MSVDDRQFWFGVLMVIFMASLISILSGCSHLASPISVASATDHISAVQGNLSAVDGKAVVIENWLKSH